MNDVIATTGPTHAVTVYETQVIHLGYYMQAHMHALLKGLPRGYRHLTRRLYRSVMALLCHFNGQYPDGC